MDKDAVDTYMMLSGISGDQEVLASEVMRSQVQNLVLKCIF